MPADTFAIVTSRMRTFLDDPDGVWTDALLANPVAEAFDETGSDLAATGLTLPTAIKEYTAVAGNVDLISDAAGPPQTLPTDLLFPIIVFDRKSGTTEDWLPVERALIPWTMDDATTDARFTLWRWIGGVETQQRQLRLTRADNTRDLRIYYERQLPAFVSGNDIPLRGATNAIAWRAVAVCEFSRGQLAMMQAAMQMYQGCLANLTAREVKAEQYAPIQRSLYSGGY